MNTAEKLEHVIVIASDLMTAVQALVDNTKDPREANWGDIIRHKTKNKTGVVRGRSRFGNPVVFVSAPHYTWDSWRVADSVHEDGTPVSKVNLPGG